MNRELGMGHWPATELLFALVVKYQISKDMALQLEQLQYAGSVANATSSPHSKNELVTF
jgi:hypothetical protein